ncbi:hypothetical protein, partial [Paucilactobacillus suebicus]|uniref:hypothetical protein n=1 Tax=Paucilactobacillus suebicus TaxID=152335 RepID=UPI000495C694
IFFGLFVYSDVIALPVPIITFALWIYFDTNDGYKKYASFAVMVLLDIFSTLIKPNMIVLLIAVGIMITTKLIKKQWSSKTILTSMIISIVCVFIGIGTFRLENKVYNYQDRPNEELPATSWIAMSLNFSNEGMYNLTDVRKQISLPTHNAKINSEKNIIKKRIKMMGASGLLLHFFQKLSIFLGSGTFGGEKLTSQWEIEPSWYRENHQILNFQFTIISQMLLSFVFLNSAIGFLRRSSNYDNLLPLLIFIGLSTFHIFIWEVEARYAVPLYPLLLLWCADGIDSLKKITFKISRFNQVLLSFCLIACLGLLSFITPKVLNNRFSSTVVAEQGNGKYFSDENITLKARERVFTTVKVHEKSNILKIYGNHNSTKVLIILTMDGKTIKTTTTRLSEVTTMKYPKQNPGKITIEIKNLSNHDTSLGVVHSHYPVDSFHIRNIKNTYLTYYIMFQQ